MVSGKGLSSNDYTTAEKSKLAALPSSVSYPVTSVAGKTGAIAGETGAIAGETGAIAGETGAVTLTAADIGAIAGETGAEPSFTKNTAFNKNFGTAAGTVAQGNDARITGAVQNTRKINGYTLAGDITLAAGDVGAASASDFAALQSQVEDAINTINSIFVAL